MLHIFDALRDLSLHSIILRLFLASVMGMVLGIERSYSNRAAGFRTHMLVCIAGCVTAMTAIDLYIYQHIATDPTRLPAQIITGLGFLGAGTIFVTKKSTIQGLTTAAGMWTAGIVGIAIGAGFFEGGILAGFGLLFVGLELMSGSMEDFAALDGVKTFLAGIRNPLLLVQSLLYLQYLCGLKKERELIFLSLLSQ